MAAFWHPTFWLGLEASGAPATPTLAVADNGDGTGGVATITGADSTASIAVYSGTWDGTIGVTTWTSRGTRTGNGTVNVAPGNGFYWWKAISTLVGGTSVSNLVYQNLTDSDEAIHYQCLTAVKARLQALALSSIVNASVLIRKLPLDRKLGATSQPALPCAMIWPTRPTADPLAGNNVYDEYGYGVMVAFIAADNQESTLVAGLSQMLLWRQKAQRAFQNQRLVGVTGVVNARVEPQEVLLPEAWEKNLRAGGLQLRFFSREERGLT